MARVFLSYSRADEAYATRLRERLEAEASDISLWQDRIRMEGGIGWLQQVKHAIDQVEFMVLVMSPATLDSETVRKEWRYARQQGVCIYPVKAAEVDFARLPRWMSSVHFFDLDKEWPTFVQYLRSPALPLRVPFMAPDLPPGLVDRPIQFRALRDQLLAPGGDSSGITTALHGSGGFGKTTLAAVLCHDEDIATAFFDGILWVTLGCNVNLQAALTSLHNALAGGRNAFADVQSASLALADELQDRTCLVVIDDVWDSSDLQPFLRGGRNCTRLITTRNFRVAADFVHVKVDEMGSVEATSLLVRGLPEADLRAFEETARRLGEWPLLLDLANATLRHRIARGDTVEGAHQFLVRALDRRGVTRFDPLNEIKIARTMEMSLESLPALRRYYFELCVFPENTDIPLTAIRALYGIDDFDAEELVQSMHDLSLLQFDLSTGTIRLHDAIRAWIKEQLPFPKPLHEKLLDGWGDPRCLCDAYAWRWIGYHMAQAGQMANLRSLLLDFDWLRSKLRATDVNALILDCEHLKGDPYIGLLQDAIRLSAHVLSQDKSQLAGQLLGRLSSFGVSSWIPLLEKAAGSSGEHWLRPLGPSLTPPGGPLIRTLIVGDLNPGPVALFADGRTAVNSGDDGTMRVWDLESGALVRSYKPQEGPLRALVLIGAARVLLAVDQTIKLWDLDIDAELMTLRGHSGSVTSVAATADGRRAVSASRDGTIRMWCLESGAELRRISAHYDRVSTVCLLPGGRALSGSRDGKLRLWDLESGEKLKSFLVRGQVTSAAVTPDGGKMVAGLADGEIKLWDSETGVELCSMTGHTDRITAVATTSDRRRAISASADCTLRVWDLAAGEELCCLRGHADRATSLSVSADGRRAVSASNDGTLRLWALDRLGGTVSRSVQTDGITAVAASPQRRQVLCGTSAGTLQLWELDSRVEIRCLQAHTREVSAIAVAADGGRAISASRDGTVRLWNLDSGELVRSFVGHAGEISAVSMTPNGGFALTAADDGTVILWNIDSGTEIRRFTPHSRSVTAMVASDAAVFSGAWDSGSWDGALKLWNWESGIELVCFGGLTDSVTAVAVSRDFSIGITGCRDATASVWDLANPSAVLSYKGHKDWMTAVGLTPDGKHAISASYDGTLHLWEVATGLVVAKFTGDGPLTACAITPDSSIVVVGEASGVVHFLRLEAGHRNSLSPNQFSQI